VTTPCPTVRTQTTAPRRPAPAAADRPRADGYEIDDDPRRIDVGAVHRYLANEAYWALGRPLEVVERLVREADRVLGLYHEGRQVGFARVVTDGLVFAYLTDVYVLPEHQGRGLGAALVRAALEDGPHRDLRWLLHTADAQGLYRRFGFGEASECLMERPASPGHDHVVVAPVGAIAPAQPASSA
jgi:ribosomal protein S18 acetylase RimI-like enzyme